MNKGKRELLQSGFRSDKTLKHDVDKARDMLKVPASRFLKRLDIAQYDQDAPLVEALLQVRQVTIPLRQHIGVPAVANVVSGQIIQAGAVIATAPAGQLSVNIHASIDGMITEVTDEQITIRSAG